MSREFVCIILLSCICYVEFAHGHGRRPRKAGSTLAKPVIAFPTKVGTDNTDITSTLKTFETVNPEISDISLMKNGKRYSKSVQFSAFGKKFNIILYEIPAPLSKAFTIRVGDDTLSKDRTGALLNDVKMYSGECVETMECKVVGNIQIASNIFEGDITELGIEIFHIEKVKRRNLKTPQLIIYKESDADDRDSFTSTINNLSTNKIDDSYSVNSKSRGRRDIVDRSNSTCYVYIFVDHRLYADLNSSISEVMTFIKDLFTKTNLIYRETDFNKDGTIDNIGIGIAGIRIFTSEDDKNNMFTDKHEYVKKFDLSFLGSFFRALILYDLSEYCLGISFTSVSNVKTMTGASFVPKAVAPAGLQGGICDLRKSGFSWITGKVLPKSKNAISITTYAWGKRQKNFRTLNALIHEIAHSFGSPHDPPECRPGKPFGNYAVFAYSADEMRENIYQLSNCSIASMNPVIAKRGVCFVSNEQELCGNGIVEGEEDCDCGNTQSCVTTDQCCTPSDHNIYYPDATDTPCKFKISEGKVCSPFHSSCCGYDCKPRKVGVTCRHATDCSDRAVCDGASTECPESKPKPHGELCDMGRKVCDDAGNCALSLCEYSGYEECKCTNDRTKLCLLCCQENDGPCVLASELGILDGYDIARAPGSRCYNDCGLCTADATCVKIISTGAELLLEEILMASSDPSTTWLKEYWYYIVIGLFLFVLSTIISIIFIIKSNVLRAEAYKVGRFHKILRESELLKSKEKCCMLRMEEVFNSKIDKIKLGGFEQSYSNAVSRLAMFFPSVPKHLLARSTRECSSEDTAIRLLLMRGYPLRSLDS